VVVFKNEPVTPLERLADFEGDACDASAQGNGFKLEMVGCKAQDGYMDVYLRPNLPCKNQEKLPKDRPEWH
jgi:hypothetical protein